MTMQKVAFQVPEITPDEEEALAEEYERRRAMGEDEVPMDQAFPSDDEEPPSP